MPAERHPLCRAGVPPRVVGPLVRQVRSAQRWQPAVPDVWAAIFEVEPERVGCEVERRPLAYELV